METKLANIPCTIDRESLLKKLHVKSNSSFIEEVDDLIDQALKIGSPKIAYKVSYIDFKGEDYVIIEGIKFSSRILRVNLEETFKLVAFVITCGLELEKWANSYDSMFERFFIDGIMEAVLHSARKDFFLKIDEEYNLGHTIDMHPGSLTNWLIDEQKPLFQLLGNVEELIGVQLTDSFLMTPVKSSSGFHFAKEGNYINCQLCPREECPGRKASYEDKLYEKKYLQK